MSVNLWGAEITFRVSSAAPDAEPPVWVDLSDRVIVPSGQTIETWLGKATELPTSDPGRAKLALLNNDDALTPGNTTSAYYPWWKQTRRFQITETVYSKEFVLADGYLEIPQLIAQVQPTGADDIKMIVLSVTGIDILQRLRNGRRFQSALAEYIVYQGGTDLAGYWPMTQAREPLTGFGPTTAALTITRTASGTRAPDAYPAFQSGSAPTGGEASGMRVESRPDGPGHAFVTTNLPESYTPTVGAADALTLVFWWSFPPSMTANDATFQQIFLASGPTTSLTLERDTTTGVWTLTAAGGLSGSITGGAVGFDALLPIGVYLRESTGAMELWTGSVRRTTTLTGSGGAGTFSLLMMGYQLDYDLSHLQVYVGTSWGYTQYLAQIAEAHAPLDRQTTGQRVETILNYARFPPSRRAVDTGIAVMSQTTLAGKSPGTALEEPLATERGRLFAQAGVINFHDRTRVYNV